MVRRIQTTGGYLHTTKTLAVKPSHLTILESGAQRHSPHSHGPVLNTTDCFNITATPIKISRYRDKPPASHIVLGDTFHNHYLCTLPTLEGLHSQRKSGQRTPLGRFHLTPPHDRRGNLLRKFRTSARWTGIHRRRGDLCIPRGVESCAVWGNLFATAIPSSTIAGIESSGTMREHATVSNPG